MKRGLVNRPQGGRGSGRRGAWRALVARVIPKDDLLHQRSFRRLWSSVLLSSVGQQVTLLALPLSAAVLLEATPWQMGWLTALEVLPFALLSLPAGVWLDRRRKLPVYVAGEALLAAAVATVPLAWALDLLSMPLLWAVALVIGLVNTTAGSAGQVVLTQVVSRDRLVEAHAKNTLASSVTEVVGPGLAGVLIKLVGAPFALLVDAVMLMFSATILRGVQVDETVPANAPGGFRQDLNDGLRFVVRHRLLLALACTVGGWQLCNHIALVVQILLATRELGLSEQAIGGCYAALGLGSVLASLCGHRVSERFGPGPSLVLGLALTAVAWLGMAASPASVGWTGAATFALSLLCFGVGAVLLLINFVGLRQAATPTHLLGRMTSTMRWLILLPAVPGALLGGWCGERLGLRSALALAGVMGLLLALLAWRQATIRNARQLPALDEAGDATPARSP